MTDSYNNKSIIYGDRVNYKGSYTESRTFPLYIGATGNDIVTYNPVLFTYSNDSLVNKIDDSNNFINEDLEESYIDLYGTLEFAKESNINKNKENIESAVDSFVSQIEGMENVIDFLIENKNEWEINDDMIVFDDTSLSNEYNDMISSIR